MKRYFEFVSDKSNKFWEITMSGTEVTTRYGKIGSAGRSTTKNFPDEEKAKKFADKILAEKTGEGYVEKTQ
jgi:predicted DNA-binding WGR domain protein